MLQVLFMIAVIVIGIALLPITLAILWFVLPWMLLGIGIMALLLLHYFGQGMEPFDQFLRYGGSGSLLLGLFLLAIRDRSTSTGSTPRDEFTWKEWLIGWVVAFPIIS